MTTDILDLPGWTVLAKRLEDREYELEAEYTVKPAACQKCGVLDRLYRHGTKDTIYRDSPIRGHATRILARVQRYRCRECSGAFEPASLFVHLTPAVVPGEHRKPMLLCQNCHRRFHTDEASGHASDSTH